MKPSLFLMMGTLLLACPSAFSFCGFFVAKAGTDLFNQASKVVIVRDGERTVLTMVNDYEGEPREFAMVVPVPTFLEKEQIHVTENKFVAHLDAYTAPRLVEYFDEDPCVMREYRRLKSGAMAPRSAALEDDKEIAKSLGVTIEAEYTVGEYDILILSAEESDGLETWLNQNGYKMPKGAANILDSYIKQKMRFFVAKINLKEKEALGTTTLRPLQVAYESPKFVLPIRLGTLNAKGAQDLFAFILSRKGRAECVNYRTEKIPSGNEIPVYVKEEFPSFYRDMFETAVSRSNMKTVFLEYAWDMAWCDPCAADPLSPEELRELGVFWVNDADRRRGNQAQDVFVTRLHVRYTAETFPEDLSFQITNDRENFQGRYVLRHPWKGKPDCDEGRRYLRELPKRLDQEAMNLANLTGWKIDDIRKKIEWPGDMEPPVDGKVPWWKNVWKN